MVGLAIVLLLFTAYPFAMIWDDPKNSRKWIFITGILVIILIHVLKLIVTTDL